MTVHALLAELRSRDVRLWADGDRLRCSAPADALTPELHGELQRRKPDILEFLRSAVARVQQQRAIVPLQPHGTRTPIFAVGGHNGDVFCYRALAQHLGEDQPLYGLQPPGLDGHREPLERIEDLAAYFAAQIHAFRPEGPCIIAGYCAGGMIAFELARQLLRQRAIAFVALFGAPFPSRYRPLGMLQGRLGQELERVRKHAGALAMLPGRGQYIARWLRERKARRAAEASAARDPVLARRARVEQATVEAGSRYSPARCEARICLFLPSARWAHTVNEPLRWRALALEARTYAGPEGCDLNSMLREPHVSTFAELFRRAAQDDQVTRVRDDGVGAVQRGRWKFEGGYS